MTKELKKKLIDLAIQEDFADGDHTSLACIGDDVIGKANIIVRQEGLLAGIELAEALFQRIDPELEIISCLFDGDNVSPGDEIMKIEGKQQSILKAERLVLNFLQRMSGIATKTQEYVDAVADTGVKILDTRKTTPGLRVFEKEAVRIGGGVNHRMGLFDMIMLKDNHIDFVGNIEKAIEKVQKYLKQNDLNLPVEIEVRTFEEIERVLKVNAVNRIMLDNFPVEDTRIAVEMINGKVEVESSGGITLDTIRDYAETGVDYISVGDLTHHIKSLDISLYVV